MPDAQQPRDLIPWLKWWMEANDLTALDVAKTAGYTTNSPVSMVLRGEKPIALERLDDWARGLKLYDEKDKEHFFLLARLATSPPEVRAQLWRYHDQLESLKKARQNSRDEIAALTKRLEELEGKRR